MKQWPHTEKIILLVLLMFNGLNASCFEEVPERKKRLNVCPEVSVHSEEIFNYLYAHIESLTFKNGKLYFRVGSSHWADENDLTTRFMSYDPDQNSTNCELINQSDLNTEHGNHISQFDLDNQRIIFSTYKVDLKGVATGKVKFQYSTLYALGAPKDNVKVLEWQVIQGMQIDSEYLYLMISDRKEEPYTHKLVRVNIKDFGQPKIVFEDKKRCMDSFAVTANRIFILSCNGELLIKDKSSFDTISKVNLKYEDKRPYYIKVFNDRLYIGYAKSVGDYSWADIGYVDINHSGIKKEHIKFMGLNMNNVFDSFAFDGNNMYIAYKAGCIIRIEHKVDKQ